MEYSRPGVVSKIDAALAEMAANAFNIMKDKNFAYKVFEYQHGSGRIIAEGICKVISRFYDRGFGCDLITIEDINTKETFHGSQYKFNLIEIEE